MQVSVRFFTTLREVTGKKEGTLEFRKGELTTVRAALSKLSGTYGDEFKAYVFDRNTGEVKGFLQFLINGRNDSTMGGLEAKLKDGDVLAIIPPVGGG